MFLFSYVITLPFIITIGHGTTLTKKAWVSLWWVLYKYRHEGKTLVTSLEIKKKKKKSHIIMQ